MKKVILLFTAIVGLLTSATAQFVSIPDANLRAFLQQTYPTCFNAQTQMDTTCTPIISATRLDLNNRNINDLTGVQYFDALDTLRVYQNLLTSLPVLPSSLSFLHCGNNQLTTITSLPPNLLKFYGNNNLLSGLPTLPNSLEELDVYQNNLTTLPTLPNNLINLECSFNQLNTLPTLPTTLQTIYTYNNALSTLPDLPIALNYLNCANNQLVSLPNLPANLQNLDISYNQISALPSLPSSLKNLNVNNNQVVTFPILPPALQVLQCANNSISCLPFLPATLQVLGTSNTYINCVPNRPVGVSTTLPLCTENNSNGCLYYARIYGKVYEDNNNNCLIDAVDELQKNVLVRAVEITTQTEYVTNSNEVGEYELALPMGTYVVDLVPPSVYWTNCFIGQSLVISQNAQQETFDFLLKAEAPCADMQIDHQLFNLARPCQTAIYKISCFNMGTIASEGTYTDIQLPPELSFETASRTHIALPNNTYRFQIGDIASLERDTFSLHAKVACSAQLGQVLCTHAEVLPHTYCIFPPNWDGSDITLSGHCVGQDSVRFIITNIGTNAMQEPRSYNVVEDNLMIRTGLFQLSAGESDSITVVSNPNRIYRIIAQESANNPAQNTQESFLIWGCSGGTDMHWGFVNEFPLNTGDNHIHHLCSEVRTSYNRMNEITAMPTGAQSSHYILEGTEIEYKIRFQNIGNDTAFVVRVVGTLSPDLDPTTLRMGSSSHPFTYTLHTNGVIEFLFQNILLSDSVTNEMNSIGFLSYKIKTKTDLPNNAVISHQAQIFFDANTSIVTNTVFHTVVDSIQNVLVVSTASVITPENYTVKVMPNPMQDRATIEIMPLGNSILTNTKVQLYNVAGQLVQEKYFTGNTCVITRDNLPQGCYYYTIQNDKQAIARGKILILK